MRLVKAIFAAIRLIVTFVVFSLVAFFGLAFVCQYAWWTIPLGVFSFLVYCCYEYPEAT